jgi:cytochrome c oxidase assembly factor CtaG
MHILTTFVIWIDQYILEIAIVALLILYIIQGIRLRRLKESLMQLRKNQHK